MEVKMFSTSEPPKTGAEVVFVIKKVCFKSDVSLVELLVDIGCEDKGRTEKKREELVFDQINPYDDSRANCAQGRVLQRRQNKNPPSPYTLETCFLANILPFQQKWSEKARLFFKSELEKQYSGLVEDVLMPDRVIILDIPSIANFLSQGRMARKIEASHFKGLVLSSLDSSTTPSTPCSLSSLPSNSVYAKEAAVQYLYLELQSALFENIKVTQVTNPGSLFCKLTIFSKELKKLSHQMQLHYTGSSALAPGQPWANGSPCATRSTDGTWQRSQLTQAVANVAGLVEVLHVDCGETQQIPTSEVRHLHERFLRIPVVTYHCAIHGAQGTTWHKDQIDVLKSLTSQVVLARFECYDEIKDIYDVTLFGAEAECINTYFTGKLIGLPDSSNASSDSAPENDTDTDDMEERYSPKIDLSSRFLQCSTSPEFANGRTADDKYKYVEWKCLPNTSLHEKENLVQNGHGNGHKITISEQFLPVGSSMSVKVSFIESPAMFFCQKLEHKESLRHLMDDLQRYYENSSVEKPCNDFCVARRSDNNTWYRGRIIDNQQSIMVVRFIDYGQTEKVPLDDLRPIEPRFMRSNAYSFQCALHNPLHPASSNAALWSNCATEEFNKIIDAIEFSKNELKCMVKATTCNPQGFVCCMVDMGTPLQSMCNLLTQMPELHSENLPVVTPVPQVTPGHSLSTNDPDVDVQSTSRGPVASQPSSAKQSTLEIPRNKPCTRNGLKTSGLSVQSALVDAGEPVNSSVIPTNTIPNATLKDLPPRLLKQGLTSVVHVSHFSNPSRFFVQLKQDEKDLYTIAEKLNDPGGVFSGPVVFDSLIVGNLISAEFPDDGSWYRAVVEQMFDDGTLNVRFIDFGNEARIPCVKACYLCKEFHAQPRFSITCTFGDIGNNQEQWDQEAISAFQSSTVANPEKTYLCTFIKETQNVWDIVLEDQGIVLAQTLIKETQTGPNLMQIASTEETFHYTKPDVTPNNPYQVYATCIVGPHFFWCQHKNSAVLDKVSKLLEDAGQLGGQDPVWVETLSIGSPCLALFPDDGQWYRAQVIRRAVDTLSVMFIDYGNEAEVDKSCIKVVPGFLFAPAPQAFLCSLEGFEELKGAWRECASDEFYELVVDKALVVTPLEVGDHQYTAIPQYTVKVEVGGTTVNKDMENYWRGSTGGDGDTSPAYSPTME